MLLPIAGAEL